MARKLDYIGVNSERKRKLIKLCINPIHFLAGGYYIKRQINKTYNLIKKEMNKLEEERKEYEKLFEEEREIYKKLNNEIKYITLAN